MQEDARLDFGTLKVCFNFDKVAQVQDPCHVTNLAQVANVQASELL